MRNLTTITLLIGILACGQSKQPDKVLSELSLATQEFNYAAYSWHFPKGQWEFYLDRFLHIKKNGEFELMVHDSANISRYYTGTINDTIRALINKTISVDTFRNNYKSTPLQNIAYSGYTYYFDYLKEKEIKKRIVFIQTRSPKPLEVLSIQLDQIIRNIGAKEVDTINIAAYVKDVRKFSSASLGPAPTIEKPNLQAID